jgi:hypothetical protein
MILRSVSDLALTALAAAGSLPPAYALAFGEVIAVTYKGTRVCLGSGAQKVSFQGTIRFDEDGGGIPVTLLDDEVGSYPEPPFANWEPLSAKEAGFGFGGFDIPLSELAQNTQRIDSWTGTASLRNGTEISKGKGQRTIFSFEESANCQAVLKFSGTAGDDVVEKSRSRDGGSAGARGGF